MNKSAAISWCYINLKARLDDLAYYSDPNDW